MMFTSLHKKMIDKKEQTLKAIKRNHEDGLLQSEIKEMFNYSRYEVEIILKELQIEQRIRAIPKGRCIIYKEIKK